MCYKCIFTSSPFIPRSTVAVTAVTVTADLFWKKDFKLHAGIYVGSEYIAFVAQTIYYSLLYMCLMCMLLVDVDVGLLLGCTQRCVLSSVV